MTEPAEVTLPLKQTRSGVPGASERFAATAYAGLRQLGASRLRFELEAHTFSATDLVNEAWLRFSSRYRRAGSREPETLLGIALTAMRSILVEHARARNAAKRGGEGRHVDLDSIDIATFDDDQLIAVDEALTRLDVIQPRGARVVEFRFLGGYSHCEIAGILDIQRRTVDRDWAFARAWLFGQIGQPPRAPSAR